MILSFKKLLRRIGISYFILFYILFIYLYYIFYLSYLFSIGPAQKIDELRPDPSDDVFKEHYDFKVARGLCWHVVFAPDESYFAWISSPKKVILVPWDKEKNCLYVPKINDYCY